MKKTITTIAALTFIFSANAQENIFRASIKGDSDLSVAKAEQRSAVDEDSADSSQENARSGNQRVEENDTAPKSAEIARNRDFNAGEIDEPDVKDELSEQTDEKSIAQNSEPKNNAQEQQANENPSSENSEIAKTDDSAKPEIAEAQTESEEKQEIVPSRSVSMKNNQRLSVRYPGLGWSFMGEIDANEAAHIVFMAKRSSFENTDFALRSLKSGETMLHFYKTDSLTGKYIDDYLLVKIDAESSDGEVSAPLYSNFIPKKPEMDAENLRQSRKRESIEANTENVSPLPEIPSAKNAVSEESKENAKSQTQDENVRTVIQNSNKAVSKNQNQEGNFTRVSEKDSKADENKPLLELAQKAFDEGKHAEALVLAQKAFDEAQERDRALFLLGQAFEAKSPSRNIRKAILSYDSIVRDFPASDFWTSANERLIFLRRFYIDIR